MQAFTTTYHARTDTRGAKIVASNSDGLQATVRYRESEGWSANHARAALAFCKKLSLRGTLQSGELDQDTVVWVFIDEGNQVRIPR